MFASAALIGQEAIATSCIPQPIANAGLGHGVMAVSIAPDRRADRGADPCARRAHSVAVSGDRAHYPADLASNVIACVAIGGQRAHGLARLDALGGARGGRNPALGRGQRLPRPRRSS